MRTTDQPGKCFYCKGIFPRHLMTRDHIIPKWVLRIFPEFTEPRGKNYVKACRSCNGHKGGMPAAEFIRVRAIPGEAKKIRKRWDAIMRALENLAYTDPMYLHYRRLVLRAYTVTASGLPTPSLSPIGNAMHRIQMQDDIDAKFETVAVDE